MLNPFSYFRVQRLHSLYSPREIILPVNLPIYARASTRRGSVTGEGPGIVAGCLAMTRWEPVPGKGPGIVAGCRAMTRREPVPGKGPGIVAGCRA